MRELAGELVEQDEREDFERAVSREEPEERLPDRLAQASRRDHLLLGLGRLPREHEHRDVDEREQHVDRRPAEARRHRDRAAARDDQRRAVDRDARADGGALFVLVQDLDRVGVDGDVLRRGRQRRRERERADHPDRLGSAADAREQQAEHRQRDLRHRHPSAPPAPERRDVAVHQRRPEHLEGPGHLRQGEESDDPDIDADAAHPVGDGVPDEAERQAGRKGEERDGQRAPGTHRARKALEGARTQGPRGGRRRHRLFIADVGREG